MRSEVAGHYALESPGKEMTGYSRTPLAQKLRIKAGQKVAALGAPKTYRKLFAPLPKGVSIGAEEAAFV